MSINSINTNLTSNRPIRDSQSTNNGVINRPRTPSFSASTINAVSTTQSSAKPLEGYSNLTDWKTDRLEVFNKYSEAGDKAMVPRMGLIRSSAYSGEATVVQNRPERNVGEGNRPLRNSSQTNISGTNSNTSAENTVKKGSAVALPWSDDNTREYYGNYFVYNMERITGDIVRAQNSIQRNQQNVTFHELANANGSGSTESETVINSATSSISRAEQLIIRRLNEITSWAEKSGLSAEAASFFEEYTAQYFGNAQTLESLRTKYSAA